MKELITAGVDEVGRGCLAGPVVSAAVILKEGINLSLLKDSKKLTFKKRDEISRHISDKKFDEIKVIIEHVSAMPGQGVTSMFNFGQSFGILKGICSAMNLPMYFVRPAKWKKHFNLINSSKDASRTKAIEIFPYFSTNLSKKKDANKADAILIASYFWETFNNK